MDFSLQKFSLYVNMFRVINLFNKIYLRHSVGYCDGITDEPLSLSYRFLNKNNKNLAIMKRTTIFVNNENQNI